MNRKPPILNIDAVSLEDWVHGDGFAARLGAIGRHLGARKLGYRLVVLPPGKAAWPLHAHYVNEEMFFILQGQGCLRLGPARHPLRAGDVIAMPPGPERPHQIVNDSREELRYLAVSTMEEPDIVEMPDSGKINIMVGSPPGGNKSARKLSACFPKGAAVDYWEGES
ncbi:cupin domain-containing protein [Thiohalobacter sp. IOR34]|uniref:cupin domain-containing protein n=1 Tax=Thiohalobacter sp. IOR34 TaxID=3057176 RepID=UPI0025AFB2D5|nr:cupin domain-containing protein [Thiohalobacter sp. IOR34]WJW76435.1 cupin domain-containing protein [Thiohalobacter sp. IOR34]